MGLLTSSSVPRRPTLKNLPRVQLVLGLVLGVAVLLTLFAKPGKDEPVKEVLVTPPKQPQLVVEKCTQPAVVKEGLDFSGKVRLTMKEYCTSLAYSYTTGVSDAAAVLRGREED